MEQSAKFDALNLRLWQFISTTAFRRLGIARSVKLLLGIGAPRFILLHIITLVLNGVMLMVAVNLFSDTRGFCNLLNPNGQFSGRVQFILLLYSLHR